MFEVKSINCANKGNERGRRTWEWKQSDGRQITVYKRRRDESFAAHFHKGEDPAKNPELFLLTGGSMWGKFIDQYGYKREIVLAANEGELVELVIKPLVLHEMKAVTDCTYIEYRPRYFDPKHTDTYPAEKFYELFPTAIQKN